MIGSALKKLAKEQNMTISGGVAYGSFCGYAVTLSEGSGYKLMAITTKFPDEARRQRLELELAGHDMMKEFRVQDLTFMEDGILINFYDTMGTMKKIRAFVDHFFPLLQETGAWGADICTECGQLISGGGSWKLVNGVAFHLHESCANRLEQNALREQERIREEDTGTYGKGAVGALVGALIGAVVWAIVLYIGYLAAIVGLLIGFLAELLYRKFGGKNGGGKLVILIVAAIIGVLVGTIGADVITLATMISSGEIMAAYGDIPAIILEVLLTDPAYLTGTLGNIGLGLVFALLGMWGVLKKTKRETASFRMKDL